MPHPGYKKFSLNKKERLKRNKIIEQLFNKGNTAVISPLRIVWMVTHLPETVPVQAAFMVSKQKFTKATDRNTVKRRMREAYRINKQEIYNFFSEQGTQCALVFIYLSTDLLPFYQVQEATKSCLNRLINHEKRD